jgi:hypothetical protein
MSAPDRVIDVFPMNDETDLLVARIHLGAGVVTDHIAVEGDRTFQGERKSRADRSAVAELRQRETLTAPPGTVWAYLANLPAVATAWEREQVQRDAGIEALAQIEDLDPDALVLSCDIDEFVDPAALERIWHACGEHRQVALGMRNIVFGDWENEQPLWHARAFRARHAPTSLHQLAAAPLHGVYDCGWHLTWLGDVDRRRRKAMAFSHSECQPGFPIWRWIEKGRPDPTGTPHRRLDDLSNLPEVLQQLVAATNGDHP